MKFAPLLSIFFIAIALCNEVENLKALDTLFHNANALCDEGQFDQAAVLYKKILASTDNHPLTLLAKRSLKYCSDSNYRAEYDVFKIGLQLAEKAHEDEKTSLIEAASVFAALAINAKDTNIKKSSIQQLYIHGYVMKAS